MDNQETAYDQLMAFNQTNQRLNETTKRNYGYLLSILKDYDGSTNDYESLWNYIDARAKRTSKIQLLNVLVSYYDKIGKPEIKLIFYDLRNDLIKNEYNTPSGENTSFMVSR